MQTRIRTGLAGVALAGSVAVALLPGTGASGTEEDPSATALLPVGSQIDSVATESPALRERFKRYQDSLVASCMAESGFEFFSSPSPASESPSHPYGLTGDSDRGSYEVVRSPAAETAEQDAYLASLGPEGARAWWEALLGDDANRAQTSNEYGIALDYSTDGCIAESRRAISGDLDAAMSMLALLQGVRWDARATAAEDPRVTAALDDWRECMLQAGLEVDSPLDPFWVADGEATGPVAPEHLRTADLECKRQSRVVRIWSSAEVQREAQLLDDHPGLLDAFEEHQQRQITRLRRAGF